MNFDDPFGLAVEFRGLDAEQLWKSLQAQAVAWALSDDKDEQRKGTRLLGMMNRIYASERVVEIGIDDGFGGGDPNETRTGNLGNGRLGINVSMGAFGGMSLSTKLVHELGHAYAAIHLGMPLPDQSDERRVNAHQAFAVGYEHIYRSLRGCRSRNGFAIDPRPCQ